jgi:hypothetical protein
MQVDGLDYGWKLHPQGLAGEPQTQNRSQLGFFHTSLWEINSMINDD